MTTTIITNNSTGGDFSGTDDLRIAGGAPTTNFGSDATFDWDTGSDALIRFPGLSNIAGPVTVSAVTLSLYIANNPGAQTNTLFRLLRAWTEAGCTWNKYDGTNDWTTAGGLGSGSDIAGSSSGAIGFSASGTGYVDFTGSAGMIADVEGWINGTFANQGWRMAVNSDYYTVGSKNGTDTQRPKLTVVHTAASSAQAPRSMQQHRHRRA